MIKLHWVSSGRKQKQLWNKRGMRWDLCPSRRQTGIYKHPISSVNQKLFCLTIFDKACNLPMVPGPCEGSYFHYGYNPERGICEQFKYGGCLGELLLRKLQMHYWVAPQETTTSSKQSRSATKCALKTTSSWCWQTNASSPLNRVHGEISANLCFLLQCS